MNTVDRDWRTLEWRILLLPDLSSVRAEIQRCEGQHVQQVSYSTYHDALTQVCFTERRIRTNAQGLIDANRPEGEA